jgi:hypothetical protein
VTVKAEIIPSQEELPCLGDNNYTLTCNDTVINVDRASLQSPTITYTWFKNSSKTILYKEQTITFRSLTYEDTGNYTCHVSVNSSSLPHELNTTTSFLLITQGTMSYVEPMAFLSTPPPPPHTHIPSLSTSSTLSSFGYLCTALS